MNMRAAGADYYPFVCFTCRRSFKRPSALANGPLERECPHCGGSAIRLSRQFKAPPSSDLAQWRKVKSLVDAGFTFASIYEWRGDRHVRVRYPDTMREVSEFIRRYGDTIDGRQLKGLLTRNGRKAVAVEEIVPCEVGRQTTVRVARPRAGSVPRLNVTTPPDWE